MRKSTKIVLTSLLAAVSALSLCSCASTDNTATNDTAALTTKGTVAKTTEQETTVTSTAQSKTEQNTTVQPTTVVTTTAAASTSSSSDTYKLVDELEVAEDKEYQTLEEYYNTDVMQETIKESEETLKNEVYSAKILCEDNTLVYQYTYANTYIGDTLTGIKNSFEKTMESMGSAFETIADNLNSIITEPCTVKCRYLNGDGTTLYEKEFS